MMVLVLLPLLVSLGFWQLERAQQKRAIQQAYLERVELEAVQISAARLDPTVQEFRRAEVHGVYEPEYQVLLDNRVYQGKAGYHVITPFRIDGATTRILINRGWIPWGVDRQRLPKINTPNGNMLLRGRLRRPPERYFSLENEAASTNFQILWQNLNLSRYQKLVDFPVQPLVLELDPNETENGDFVRQWPTFQDGWVERHRGYAFQWFALATALVLIYVIVNLQRRKVRQSNLSL